MANSRLYIFDPDTKTSVMIAKSMGGGWYVGHEDIEQRLNNFFDNLADNNGWGFPTSTALELVTEYELPSEPDSQALLRAREILAETPVSEGMLFLGVPLQDFTKDELTKIIFFTNSANDIPNGNHRGGR